MKSEKSKSGKDGRVPYYLGLFLALWGALKSRAGNAKNLFDPTLVQMAGLPLVDGYYLVALATGLLADPVEAVIFGITAFSGGGCIGAVVCSNASNTTKVKGILALYAGIGIVALGFALMHGFWASIMIPGFSILTALFLLSLGLTLAGFSKIGAFLTISPGAVPRIMMGALAFNILLNWDLLSGISLETSLLSNVGLAVASAGAFTLIGVVISTVFKATGVGTDFTRKGQGLALFCMGLRILWPAVPTLCTFAPLIAGLLGDVAMATANRLREKRRQQTVADALTLS